jgi:hypothetical protein
MSEGSVNRDTIYAIIEWLIFIFFFNDYYFSIRRLLTSTLEVDNLEMILRHGITLFGEADTRNKEYGVDTLQT